jgi:hypothetical protein
MNGRACLLLALSALSFSAALGNSGARAVPPGRAYAALGHEDGDGDLLPFAEGPNVLLKDDRFKAETDVCGMLQRMESRRSTITHTAYSDESDGDDEDPSSDPHNLMSQWFSEHSNVAVISDEVDKWCDDPWFEGDDEFPPEFTAGLRSREHHRRVDTSYIA